MGANLKNLRTALEGDWLDADPKVESHLQELLGRIAEGEGVVLQGPGSAAVEEPVPHGKILIPTGGTTGTPRFAIHTWETLSHATGNLAARIGGPVHGCCILPLHHVSGFMQVVRALATGGRLHVPDPRTLDVDPHELCLSLVPTQLGRFLEHSAQVERLRQFRMIFLGGAAASPDLLDQARCLELPLAPCYGMTETAAMVTLLEPSSFLAGKEGCGTALPNCAIRIQDGRIEVHTKSLFEGYWPGDTHDAPSLETQDSGFLDKDGHLHVTGRLDRVIVTGGEKVDPAEVEAALLREPGVREALVLGVEDSDWGHRVVAYVVGESEEVLESLRLSLPPHKLPKELHCVERLPLSGNGKVAWDQVRDRPCK